MGSGDLECLMPWANNIEKNIGYTFRERGFLLQVGFYISYMPNITFHFMMWIFLGVYSSFIH